MNLEERAQAIQESDRHARLAYNEAQIQKLAAFRDAVNAFVIFAKKHHEPTRTLYQKEELTTITGRTRLYRPPKRKTEVTYTPFAEVWLLTSCSGDDYDGFTSAEAVDEKGKLWRYAYESDARSRLLVVGDDKDPSRSDMTVSLQVIDAAAATILGRERYRATGSLD